jgi:membrane protease subunit (stomatin/prohibitin family)
MPFVRRRPLLRAAAVGGVAYMGAKAGTNRAKQQQAAQQAQPAVAEPAPPPAAAAGDDTITRLQKLADLHNSGALTDEEFAAAKAQVLA